MKITKTFDASIVLNPEKGGGWLAKWHIHDGDDKVALTTYSAWKNASAAKRWLKAAVQANTPRKSVKMEPIKLNELQKPVHFAGSLTFKGEK